MGKAIDGGVKKGFFKVLKDVILPPSKEPRKPAAKAKPINKISIL